VITPLIADPNDDIAINALRIAGELGTSEGANLCVAVLEDTRPGVRMMAASGLARTFGILSTTATIQSSQFLGIEGRIGQAVAQEKDPEVLDGFAMAYEAAIQVPGRMVPEARNLAMKSAAVRFGERVRHKDMSSAGVPAMLRASKAMLDSLSQALGEVKPAKETFQEMGGFGGDLLAYALRRIDGGGLTEAERTQLAVLVGQAQNLVSVCSGQLNLPGRAYQLDALIREEKDSQFKRDVMNVIGGQGDLVNPPFNHRKERFIPAP
jgi:hypothetical protein